MEVVEDAAAPAFFDAVGFAVVAPAAVGADGSGGGDLGWGGGVEGAEGGGLGVEHGGEGG